MSPDTLVPRVLTSASAAPMARRRPRRPTVGTIALVLSLCILAIPFVFPLLWMLSSSLKPLAQVLSLPPNLVPANPTLQPYIDVFDQQPFAQQYWNSLYIAVVVTVCSIAVASLAGYAFARIKFPGANALFLVVLLGLLLPSEVTIVPLFQLFSGLGLIDTHWPLILIPVFGAPSVMGIFIMRQFFIALPGELEEAGQIDGLSRFGIFRRIALPLAGPAIASVAIFTFLHSWNMFLEPLVFLTTKTNFTLPLALTQYVDLTSTPIWNVQMAAATMTVIPVLVVFIFAQRQFVQGLAQTGLKG